MTLEHQKKIPNLRYIILVCEKKIILKPMSYDMKFTKIFENTNYMDGRFKYILISLFWNLTTLIS